MRKLTILNVSLALGLITNLSALQAEECNVVEAKKKPPKKAEKKPPAKANEKVNPLKDALTSSYVTNSNLKAKLHQQFALDENVNQAFSAFRPQVSATGSLSEKDSLQKAKETRNSLVTPDNDPDDPKSGITNQRSKTKTIQKDRTATVQVKQSIYRGGGDIANLRAQEYAVKAGQYELSKTEQETLLNAVIAYMEVVYQTATVRSNQANIDFLSQSLKAVKSQVEVGEQTPTETAAAEAQLAQGEALLKKSEGALADAKANYLTVIGQQPGLLAYPASLPGIPKNREEVIATALKNNPVVLSAEFTDKQQSLTIDVQTANLLPQVDLTGNATRDLGSNPINSRSSSVLRRTNGVQLPGTSKSKSTNQTATNAASVQIQLTVPLYQGGAEYSKVRQQVETTAAARYNLEQARKTTEENAIIAWDGVITAGEQIKSLEKQVASATIARDGAQKQADVGERSAIDVLDFQTKLLNARNNLDSAKKEWIVAQYRVYQAMGKLTARELELPVTIYDVEGHLDNVRYKIAGFGDRPAVLDEPEKQPEILIDCKDETNTTAQD
jgi:outer membrane protein